MEVSKGQRGGSLVAAGARVIEGTLRPEAANYQGDARGHAGEEEGVLAMMMMSMVMNLVVLMIKIGVSNVVIIYIMIIIIIRW